MCVCYAVFFMSSCILSTLYLVGEKIALPYMLSPSTIERGRGRGRGLAEWSMALQSVCIAVERKTVGSSPGVAVVFLQSQLVF
mgnify:CR=1 FL=1